jgi:hypothetical protein
MKLHPDFVDFMAALNTAKVDYVIVGAYALAFYGIPRATGDIDFWIRPTFKNAEHLLLALQEFGFGELDIRVDDILSGKIIQLGYPPVRIDMLSKLTGLGTDEIWKSRQKGRLGEHDVFFLGRDAYIKNKKATGRNKDLADLELLNKKIIKSRRTQKAKRP